MNNSRMIQLISLTLMVFILSAACATPQPSSTPNSPTPIPPTATVMQSPAEMYPFGRYISLAYDAESDRFIMFGGQSGHYNQETSFNDETWAYDVTTNKWTQMKPASAPGKRSDYGLAYNAKSDRVILFGGMTYNIDPLNWGFDDTWAYDYNTNTWIEMAKGPSGYVGIRLAYDSESDRIILFGGWHMKSGRFFNETWVFDFTANSWTEMKPKASPPGRNYQAMTYDSKADRVLVWGGMDEKSEKPVDESMWAYDFNTNTWTEMKPGDEMLPAGRDYPQLVYNTKADRTILYGGTHGGSETWAYDYNTNTWTNLAPAGNPLGLLATGFDYSPTADRVILFGGATGLNPYKFSDETWSYDFNINTWTNVTPKP
jgi:N-acetylneuraminic acid mutarotase